MHDLMHTTNGRGALGSYGAENVVSSIVGPALYQLNAAKSGRVLRDYRSAENVGLLIVPVSTDSDAYLKAAYWAAVAAQLQAPTNSAGLIAVAQRYYQQGATLAFNANVRGSSGSAVAILQQASREVSAYASTAQSRGIANFLNDLGQSDVVLRQAQTGVGGSGFYETLGDVSMYAWIGTGIFLVALFALTRARPQE